MTDPSSPTEARTTPQDPPNGGRSVAQRQPRGTMEATAASLIGRKMGLPLETYGDAWNFAVACAQANTVPKALQGKVPDIFVNITYAAVLGISPPEGFLAINVVEGTPSLAGDFLIKRIREFGHKFEIVESDEDRCTTRITRKDGQTQEWTYTIEEAIKGRLCYRDPQGIIRARSNNGKVLPWETSTRKMLLWRSTSNNADSICPEVAFGFALDDGSGELYEDPQSPQATATDLGEAVAQREAETAAKAAPTEDTVYTSTPGRLVPEDPPEPPPTAAQIRDLDAAPENICPTCDALLDDAGEGHEPGCSRAADGADEEAEVVDEVGVTDDVEVDLYTPTEEEIAAEQAAAEAPPAEQEASWPDVIWPPEPPQDPEPPKRRGPKGGRR